MTCSPARADMVAALGETTGQLRGTGNLEFLGHTMFLQLHFDAA